MLEWPNSKTGSKLWRQGPKTATVIFDVWGEDLRLVLDKSYIPYLAISKFFQYSFPFREIKLDIKFIFNRPWSREWREWVRAALVCWRGQGDRCEVPERPLPDLAHTDLAGGAVPQPGPSDHPGDQGPGPGEWHHQHHGHLPGVLPLLRVPPRPRPHPRRVHPHREAIPPGGQGRGGGHQGDNHRLKCFYLHLDTCTKKEQIFLNIKCCSIIKYDYVSPRHQNRHINKYRHAL